MTQALAQRPKSGGSKPPIPQRPKSGSKPRPSSAAAAKPKVVKPDLIEALKTGGLQQYAVRNRPLPRRSSPPPPPASAQSAASRTPCFGDRAITHTVSHVPEPCTTTRLSAAHLPSSAVHTHRRLMCTPTVVCCAHPPSSAVRGSASSRTWGLSASRRSSRCAARRSTSSSSSSAPSPATGSACSTSSRSSARTPHARIPDQGRPQTGACHSHVWYSHV